MAIILNRTSWLAFFSHFLLFHRHSYKVVNQLACYNSHFCLFLSACVNCVCVCVCRSSWLTQRVRDILVQPADLIGPKVTLWAYWTRILTTAVGAGSYPHHSLTDCMEPLYFLKNALGLCRITLHTIQSHCQGSDQSWWLHWLLSCPETLLCPHYCKRLEFQLHSLAANLKLNTWTEDLPHRHKNGGPI